MLDLTLICLFFEPVVF